MVDTEALATEEKVTVTLDNGMKKVIDKKRLSECPDCEKMSVRGKEMGEGGGVTCITEGCGYWFCY